MTTHHQQRCSSPGAQRPAITPLPSPRRPHLGGTPIGFVHQVEVTPRPRLPSTGFDCHGQADVLGASRLNRRCPRSGLRARDAAGGQRGFWSDLCRCKCFLQWRWCHRFQPSNAALGFAVAPVTQVAIVPGGCAGCRGRRWRHPLMLAVLGPRHMESHHCPRCGDCARHIPGPWSSMAQPSPRSRAVLQCCTARFFLSGAG